MLFIPTYCEACGHAALVPGSSLTKMTVECERCNAPALVIPGESYAESDAPLFEQLLRALREASVTPALAAQLLRQIGPRDGTPGASLGRVATSVPALGNLDLIVGNNKLTLRKADGMLATLLAVIAKRKSESGFISVVRAPDAATKA